MSKDVNLKEFIDEIILEVEKEIEEETTTGDAAGYNIPGAFSAGRKKDKKKQKSTATQAGYEVVNEDYSKQFLDLIDSKKDITKKVDSFDKILNSLPKQKSGGISDEDRKSKKYIDAKKQYNVWFKKLQTVNKDITKNHKKEYGEYRSKNRYKTSESVNESAKIDKEKNDLLKKVKPLVDKKKKLYSNTDIESPMTADEKKLNKDIASIYSKINQLVKQKHNSKSIAESVKLGDIVHVRPEKRKTTSIGKVIKIGKKDSRGNTSITFKQKNGEEWNTDDKQIRKINGKVVEACNTPKKKNRWLELKNDETMHTNKKLAKGMMNLRNQLSEVEKFLGWYNKLKNVNETEASTYWKRTNTNIRKIKERIVNIARNLQELEK